MCTLAFNRRMRSCLELEVPIVRKVLPHFQILGRLYQKTSILPTVYGLYAKTVALTGNSVKVTLSCEQIQTVKNF